MISGTSFEIRRYDFNSTLLDDFENIHYAKDLWPIVYILSDGQVKLAYVGETTDTYSRLTTHLTNSTKNKLSVVHLITSDRFNKSATLDIESNLIKYISGDGQYRLLNGNVGLANHNYYQKKEVYWHIFKSIWDKLRAEGLSKHSIAHIDNSDLFKYSPYKTLTTEQRTGLLMIIRNLCSDRKTIIVEGGAGTGKTVLAIFLFKLLNSNIEEFNIREFEDDEVELMQAIVELKNKYPNPRMALVVPMSSFRNTLKKVFKNIKDLSAKMVIGPAELVNNHFDIVVVDESHRLRRRVNLGTYFHAFDVVCDRLGFDKYNCSELDWVAMQSNAAVLFYDRNQSIKPSDVKVEEFDKLKSTKSTQVEELKSQFRVKGGNGYVRYLTDLLNCELPNTEKRFISKEYEFLLFDHIDDMIDEIRKRDSENGLSRLIAGYSWPWISKNDKSVYDIKIEGTALQWNSVSDDFINSDNALDEVGCIHTTQGYDLNYAGVIFGNEITYDKATDKIVVIKENYFDKAGKQSITDPLELKDFVINIYKTILLRGIKGTYVYVCDQNLKNYFAKHIESYQTLRINKHRVEKHSTQFENSVEFYDLKAAAGNFSGLQSGRSLGFVSLPSRYKSSNDLFTCTVVGESMNKIIPNGAMCLFRRDNGGSRNGKIVLVSHSDIQDADTGSNFTVKEYRSYKTVNDQGWQHQSIILKPLSYNTEYKDIVLQDDETITLKVIGIFECVLDGAD
jgi:DUF2075 family protein